MEWYLHVIPVEYAHELQCVQTVHVLILLPISTRKLKRGCLNDGIDIHLTYIYTGDKNVVIYTGYLQ